MGEVFGAFESEVTIRYILRNVQQPTSSQKCEPRTLRKGADLGFTFSGKCGKRKTN